VQKQPKQSVLLWLSHSDRGTYIQVIGNRNALRVFVAEELYCPDDNLEAEKMAWELTYLRLPGFWKKFYDSPETKVVATHFVQRRRPSEEARVLECLEWLQKLEDFQRRFSGGR